MNHSLLYIPSPFGHREDTADSTKPKLEFAKSDFKWPLMFMLFMALLGLRFFPALLFVLVIMLHRFRNDRYDFAIMSMMFCGCFGLIKPDVLYVKVADIGIAAGLMFAFLMKKPRILKIMLTMYIVYAAILFWIAFQSWESMRIQMLELRFYLSFISVFIPLATFANRAFDIRILVHKLMVFGVLMCVFYIVDAYVLKGHILMPGTFSWYGDSTFLHPILFPFSLSPMRIYPYGLYILVLGLIPAMRMYRIPWWIWALVALSALSTQTFTYMSALGLTLILFQGSFKRTCKIFGSMALAATLIYGIDCLLPKSYNDFGEISTLRVKSTIDQFARLTEAADDEDIAEFGSGRMAQAIPKLELVSYYDRQWIGLGFIHPDYSKSNKFIIDNEYYVDEAKSEEIATGVEIIPIQIYIHAGWIGLISHAAFFVGLYFVIRRLRYSKFYLAALFFCAVLGLGGFASLTGYQGQCIVSFAFAMVILANRDRLPGFSSEYKTGASLRNDS